MELNLERIVMERMMASHVSFFFRTEDADGYRNVFLNDITNYTRGVTYTPNQQHTNWFQYAVAKLSGRAIHYETQNGTVGVMEDDDWYFTHNIKFTVGEFKTHTPAYYQTTNPLYQYAVQAMVGCGVRFTKHGDVDGFVLTSDNFDREFPHTTFLPRGQVDNWASLAIAKIAGVQLFWSFSNADKWFPVLDSDFNFDAVCKFRFPDQHVNLDRVIQHSVGFESKDVQATTSIIIDEVQEISDRGCAVASDASFSEVAEQVLTNHQLINDLLADIDAIRRLTDRGYTVTRSA